MKVDLAAAGGGGTILSLATAAAAPNSALPSIGGVLNLKRSSAAPGGQHLRIGQVTPHVPAAVGPKPDASGSGK